MGKKLPFPEKIFPIRDNPNGGTGSLVLALIKVVR
jgi:hypothetical protein